MDRRSFLTTTGVGAAAAAATTISAPAIAQSQPEIRWRLASSFPKSLDTLFGSAEFLAKRVSEATDGRFQIRPFAAGEIVPGLQVLDAVQNGTVELGQTAPYYYVGKDKTFAFYSTVPYGLNARQHAAWMYHGGGMDLMRELFASYNIHPIPGGNTGAQMGGWFRREVKTVEDLNGLKMRVAGIAGEVLQKVGVVPQQIAGGDIYPALEKGTIDAVEWVGPYDDEKLGFQKVAKFYYYPGWWEGCAELCVIINSEQWKSLPNAYRAVLEAAISEARTWMLAKYDAQNPAALRRLVGAGTQLRPYSREILDATYKASFQLYDEVSAQNATFKKHYEAWRKFRDDAYLWFRVSENSFENYVYAQTAR